eukprot:gene33647-45065_t
MITVKWIQTSCSVEINGSTTLTSIKEKLFDEWESLERVDFSLHYGEKGVPELEINNDEKLATFLAANYSTILVKSHTVKFSELKGKTVFKWAGIGEIVEDNSHFNSIDIDYQLHGHVIDHALQDLMLKNKLYGPITDCVEASSVREYISAVLVACAMIAGNVKLVAGQSIVGKKAYGPLDFAMLYKKFFLLITEAKKDNLNNGVIQNIGQLLASREEYLYNNSLLAGVKRRNYMSMAGDIASIPSTGVASTGKEWILIRYVLLPQPAVFKSSPISLPLLNGSPEYIKKQLLTLVSKLLGAIDFQKRTVDQYGLGKAQKRKRGEEEEV